MAINLNSKNQKIICAIDVGTNKTAVIVGQKDEQNHLSIIGFGEAYSNGVKKGVVSSIEETVSSISAALEQAEKVSGCQLNEAIIAVSGAHLKSLVSDGVIAISAPDQIISPEDVYRAITASKSVNVPINNEIVHAIPSNFTVDDQADIKDPIGMSGVRLKVDCNIIYGFTPSISNLTKCVFQSGIDISELVATPLASATSVLTQRQRELGCLVVDMGAATTSLACFEEGNLIYSAVLPVGSNNITNDLAVGLRCTTEVAEKVKLQYGAANPKDVAQSAKVDLARFDRNENGEFSKKYVAQIIHARVEEMVEQIGTELKNINKFAKLPAGIVLTGGGSKLPGLVDFVKEKLALPCQIGTPRELKGIVDRIDKPEYACCIGLVIWASEEDKRGPIPGDKGTDIFNKKLFKQLLGWLKNFVPGK